MPARWCTTGAAEASPTRGPARADGRRGPNRGSAHARGRDAADDATDRRDDAADVGSSADHDGGPGRPAWAGPHDTRGRDRADEVGRGHHRGHGPGASHTAPPGTEPGSTRGPGHASPAIEGPGRPQEHHLFFYHADHLGSSNVLTDAFGDVFEHVEYFPFGEPWVDQGGGNDRLLLFTFTGKPLDAETGLYYFGARYYEPRLQRWLRADPALDL